MMYGLGENLKKRKRRFVIGSLIVVVAFIVGSFGLVTTALGQKKVVDRGFIQVDDNARIFYERVGTGKQAVVVPLHMLMYEDFKHLARGRTFIFYDVRNRGRSDSISDAPKLTIQHDVEDLEKLRQHFGIEKMTLIGESYVGLMVVMYAMKYPQHVERLVQIGPVPLKYGTKYPAEFTANDKTPVPDPAEIKKIDKLYEDGVHKTNPQEFCRRDWEVTKFGLVGDPKDVDKLRSLCHLANEWPVNLYRHFASHFASVQKLDIAKEEAAKVTVPVLTIHGTKDRNASYGSGREWATLLPNARLLTVKNAAHFPWIDDPKLVFGSIRTFLSGKFPEKAEKID
ncbi:MAG: alpha/beta fold hydrolase [Pyrinomonadaceae bacterium]